MKISQFLTISFIILCSCTRSSVLQKGRWSGDGPKPDFQSEGLVAPEKYKSGGEEIEFQEQKLASFKIENAYVKTIQGSEKKKAFQSFSVFDGRNKKSLIKRAEKLDLKKEKIWYAFLSRNPRFKEFRLEAGPEVFIESTPQLRPLIRMILGSQSGELTELGIDQNLKILRERRLGSGLADVNQATTLVFPLGPRKSELVEASVLRLINVVGLKNSQIEVGTESPNKITNSYQLELPPSDERFDQTQSFYFANQLMKWFAEKNIFDELLSVQITTQVGYPDKTNTAFYYGGRIRLGVGDDITFSKMAWDPSIVMHEVSHAVIEKIAHLPFQGEGGSINEGYADFFTTFYLGHPFLAENSYKPAPYRRSVETFMKMSEVNGGLYHDSAVVSGFFWKLRSSIPEEKILMLAIKVLNRLGPDADLNIFRTNLIEQSDLLFSGQELEKVHAVLKQGELL